MRYILFILMLIGGLLSFNSYAKGSCPNLQFPFKFDLFLAHYVPRDPSDPKSDQNPALDIHGCTYVFTSFSCPANADYSHSGSFCTATSGVLLSDDGDTDSPPSDDSSSDKPGSGSPGDSSPDDSTSAGGGSGSSDGTSSGSPTPSPSESEKPYPVNAGVSQLEGLFNSCSAQAHSISLDDDFDAQYNSVARNCNAILDRISSLLSPGKITPLSADNRNFLTQNAHRAVLTCRPSTEMERHQMKEHGFVPTDIVGSYVTPLRYRDNNLDFNYTSGLADGGYCDSIYQDYVASQNVPSHSDTANSDSSGSASCPSGSFNIPGKGCMPVSCPDGFHPVAGSTSSDFPICQKDSTVSSGGSPVMPGNGLADSGDGGNGDVVAAIDALHADVNQNHKETMDTINDLPQETPGLIEGYLSPKLNSIIDGMKKEMTDDYNDALAEFKGVFGDIDSYIPDIKLSFDLPVQFTSGIRGRCVPLVFDFNITLVGFQPYHFHAEGVQACQLYDAYIRSIVEYMLYFLTALACRRVFTRAAEFVSSQS